jgi:hypothetical protein
LGKKENEDFLSFGDKNRKVSNPKIENQIAKKFSI